MEPSIVDLLRGWTLRGNIKGDAVQRKDPEKGDLTENELIAFNEGVARAFEKGLLTTAELAMALLISCSGRRSRQISHMKVTDVEMPADGAAIFRVRHAAGQDGAGAKITGRQFELLPVVGRDFISAITQARG